MKRFVLAATLLMTAACAQQNEGNVQSATDNSAIVGGEVVLATDPIAHSTVQLFALSATRDPLGSVNYSISSCTGTLLSSKVILTAAHCTKRNPAQLFVYFSSTVPTDLNALFNTLGKNPLFRQISGGLTAANWAKLTGSEIKDWDDLALLRFEDGIPASFTTASMIPASHEIKNNDFVTLAGFGITDGVKGTDTETLRKVDVVLTDAKYSNSEILVGDESGKGACHGDSGGPAFLQVGAQKYIVGITSRADIDKDPHGVCTAGSICTSVQSHLAWIVAGITSLEAADFKPAPIAQPAIF